MFELPSLFSSPEASSLCKFYRSLLVVFNLFSQCILASNFSSPLLPRCFFLFFIISCFFPFSMFQVFWTIMYATLGYMTIIFVVSAVVGGSFSNFCDSSIFARFILLFIMCVYICLYVIICLCVYFSGIWCWKGILWVW